MPSDTLYIYDGANTSAPLIGKYNDNSVPVLDLMPIRASLTNTSGCITVRFISDGSSESNGWSATISCHQVCQEVLANLNTMLTSPSPDTGYIAICPGSAIHFVGYSTYPQNNLVYNQSDNTSVYNWYFGDGGTATGPVVDHTYAQPGGYTVYLEITDIHGCTSTNSIDTRVITAGNPFQEIIVPPTICANDTVDLIFAGIGTPDASIIGDPYHEVIDVSLGVNDTTFLPDGTGVSYTTGVTFNCFAPGQTLDNAWDIVSICANMEHSFLGDLEISLMCPNGQSIILKEYPSTGSNIGIDLGVAISDATSLTDPGTGYTYCWSPTPVLGTMVAEEDLTTATSLPAGEYAPFESFAGLVGCPLNGLWSINVSDNWAIDNGYIFSWEIEFNPLISPSIWEYTIPIATQGWTSGPHIINQTPTNLTVNPPTAGVYDYTYTIVDAVGCVWDTSVALTAIVAPVVNLGADKVFCNSTVPYIIDAGNPGLTYLWSDGSVAQTLSVNTTGHYYVTVSNGLCTAVDDIIVSFSQVTVTGAVSNVACYGYLDGSIDMTEITDAPPCTYAWSNGPSSQDLSGLTAGTYTVTVTNGKMCSASEQFEIIQPNNIVVGTTPDPHICIDQNASVMASVTGGNAPYQYLWSNGNATNSIFVTPTQTTDYSVSVTDANNCPASPANVTVFVYDSLKLDLTSSSAVICLGEPIIISGNYSGGVGSPYTLTLNSGEVISLPYNYYPPVSQSIQICLKDACSSPQVCDQVSVQVMSAPFINFQADSTFGCEPHIVNFTSWGDNDIKEYQWNFGDDQNNALSYLSNPQHEFTNDGLYNVSLTVTDSLGCKNTVTLTNLITVYPKPNSSFVPNPAMASILNPMIHYNNMSELNLNNYWIFGDGDSSIAKSPYHSFPAVGDYNTSLIVESEKGCRDTAVYTVSIVKEYTFYAPNAITPDNDGSNEVFYVTGSNISDKDFHLFVYDRWGEIIFETTMFNPDNPSQYSWEGKVKGGSIAPIGVYTWLVNYKDTNGISHEKTGSVTLIR